MLFAGLPSAIPCRAADDTPPSDWVSVSDDALQQLEREGKKTDWPGGTAGVVVDPNTGDVYMIVAGQGVWKSSDHGKSFKRCDDGAVGGRCETSYTLNFDPSGRRLACFMLDGKCAWTGDGGRTWQGFTDVGRNWDYAAVDWSTPGVKNIFAAKHESGGQVMYSNDGGKKWIKLFEDPEFDKTGGLGIFDEQTLVYTQKDKGIQRSTDAGHNWTKVSDLVPIGRIVKILNGTAYWLAREGLLVSKDQGATWAKLKALTHDSPLQHTYVRQPLHAHPQFYAYWADGDAQRESESRLYFTDREGSAVWQLPADMTGDVAKPQVWAPPSPR